MSEGDLADKLKEENKLNEELKKKVNIQNQREEND